NEIKNILRLYHILTSDNLSVAIANYYELEKENVFVGNGTDEILAFPFMRLFEPGNPIRFPDITYSFYPVYSKVFNIDYETVPLNPDFTIDITKFFQSKGGVIFPNPNAPTSLYLL